METLAAAELLAALGHESRLAIFRYLVEAGAEGKVRQRIGEHLAMAPATLSFHLAHLNRVGLISGQRKAALSAIRRTMRRWTIDCLPNQ